MKLVRLISLTLLVVVTAPAQQTERLIQAVGAGQSLGYEPKGIAALEALLPEGLDVNAADPAGWADVVRFLLDFGADVRLCDVESRSALDYVSPNRSAEIERLLVAAGTPPRSGKSGRLVGDA